MKQQKFVYKLVHTLEEMEDILNKENTDKILANVITIEQYPAFLIVWED